MSQRITHRNSFGPRRRLARFCKFTWLLCGLTALLVNTPATAREGGDVAAEKVAGFAGLRDVDDRVLDPFARPAKARVFIFVSTDCPISNRYAPEMRRLWRKFGKEEIEFWMVYPNAEASAHDIRAHRRDYQLPGAAIRDPKHELVSAARVTVTPEAAVFVPGKGLVYHGRIDDRYPAFGRAKRQATEHDLEEVLDAIGHGMGSPFAHKPAVGCYIADLP